MNKIGKKRKILTTWLNKKNFYFCEDLGCKWKHKMKIKPSDIHKYCSYNI